jgi:hypothetical protein
VFRIKRNLQLVLACGALLMAPALRAQTSPAPPATPIGADYNNRWEVSGGYAFTRIRPGFGHIDPINLMGATGQVTAWIRPAYGFTFIGRTFSGNTTLQPNIYNLTNPSMRESLFLLGPDFRVLKSPKAALGVHLLFGGTYGVFDSDLKGVQPNAVGLYDNQLAFAMSLGASYDYNLTNKISIRAVTDFQPTYYGASAQEAFAGTVGVVYKFGTLRHTQ